MTGLEQNVTLFARGSFGGRSSGGFSSRSSSSSSSKSSSSSSKSLSSSSKSSSTSSKSTSTGSGSTSTKKTTQNTAPQKKITPKTGVSTAKPGTKVKAADGKEITSSTKAPTNKKFTKSTGVVGDNGYAPRYVNGYTPPAGSVVYRESNSALDYLPWIYLFSLGGDSPRNDQQTVVEPSGKEVAAQPVQQGVDGLLILNWIVLIIIVGAIIGGIVYAVNKFTSKGKPSYV